MTKTADGNPAQPDIMPPPLDDAEPAAPAAVVDRAEPTEQAGPPVTPVVETPFQDARERIAALYRQQRENDEAEAAHALAEQQAAREAAEFAEAAGQPQQGQQRTRIVVDGKEQFLTQAELIQRAQVNSAIDARLEESKRLLRAARAERHGEDYEEDFDEAPPQPRTPTPGNQNERLKAIVEKIQVGDSDEGVEALQELTQVVHQGIQQQAFLTHNETQMKAALDRFIDRYPDVAKDPDLGNVGMTVLGRVLKAELKRTGGITDEQLATIPNDMNGVRAMAFATASLRAQGNRNVRDFDGLLDATGAELSRKFNLRPGRARSEIRDAYRIGTQAEIDARLERKRSMPYQPRPAGIRSAPEPQYQRPKTAAEIVAEQRAYRGFK